MKRILRLLPVAVLPPFFIAGHVLHFSFPVMRPLSLALFIASSLGLATLLHAGQASGIEKAICSYLAAAVLGFWFWPGGLGRLLAEWPETSLYAVFLVMAAVPPLLGGEPFTTHFARRRTAQDVWDNPVFKRINRHMTWIWASIFLACALSTSVPSIWPALSGGPLELVFRIFLPLALLLGIGFPFTRKYPDYYQRKLGLEPVRAGISRQASAPAEKEKAMSTRPTIVAVNGSPHARMGNTAIMLEMLRPTLVEEGFELEVIDIFGKEIEYCFGCAFCLEKGQCWIDDDHKGITLKLLDASGVILASPVYFSHVTAQMKTFLDRSLALGHKPRATWKPGLAVCVSAGLGETETADYLAGALRPFGAFPVGRLTAMSTNPGEFVGEESVRQRARDLARDLARAIKEKRRYPATDQDLRYYQFMSNLVHGQKDGIMQHDHRHWRELGLYENFEVYIGQRTTRLSRQDDGLRQAWVGQLISERKARKKQVADKVPPSTANTSTAGSCRELLEGMPLGFNSQAAGDLKATIQFEVRGTENFTGHLAIEDGRCSFGEGPATKADLTIKTPAEVWLAVARGEVDGQKAYMLGQFHTQGDLGLLMKLKTLFHAESRN